jgi:hypothetical protein
MRTNPEMHREEIIFFKKSDVHNVTAWTENAGN